MKNINKFLVAALVTLGLVGESKAQTMSDMLQGIYSGVPVVESQTAVDNTAALLIKYVGQQASGTVEVSAAGAITLKHGAVGAEVVDNTVECDAAIAASGSRVGVIDVSVAACDTVGEVVNIINSQSANWVVVPLNSIFTDDLNCAGSGCLKLLAATQAKTNTGTRAMVFETSVAKNVTLMLAKPEYQQDIGTYLTNKGSGTTITANKFLPSAFTGRTLVSSCRGTFTYTGAGAWSVILVKPNYNKVASTETYLVLMSGTVPSASTVNSNFVTLADGQRIVAPEGYKLLLRFTAVTTLTVADFNGFGYTFTAH